MDLSESFYYARISSTRRSGGKEWSRICGYIDLEENCVNKANNIIDSKINKFKSREGKKRGINLKKTQTG
jgi:hypothetical protein